MNHNNKGIKHINVENVDFYTRNQEAVSACFKQHGYHNLHIKTNTIQMVGKPMQKNKKNLP
jgi:hypothetical protein